MTTVMIVDDSKLARMVIAKAMDAIRTDWTRVEATNAADALAIARRVAPQIALLDYNMPDRNGLELLADLRSLYPNMVIAVVSANFQQEIIEGAQAFGATFMAKPLDQKELAAFLSGCNF